MRRRSCPSTVVFQESLPFYPDCKLLICIHETCCKKIEFFIDDGKYSYGLNRSATQLMWLNERLLSLSDINVAKYWNFVKFICDAPKFPSSWVATTDHVFICMEKFIFSGTVPSGEVRLFESDKKGQWFLSARVVTSEYITLDDVIINSSGEIYSVSSEGYDLNTINEDTGFHKYPFPRNSANDKNLIQECIDIITRTETGNTNIQFVRLLKLNIEFVNHGAEKIGYQPSIKLLNIRDSSLEFGSSGLIAQLVISNYQVLMYEAGFRAPVADGSTAYFKFRYGQCLDCLQQLFEVMSELEILDDAMYYHLSDLLDKCRLSDYYKKWRRGANRDALYYSEFSPWLDKMIYHREQNPISDILFNDL